MSRKLSLLIIIFLISCDITNSPIKSKIKKCNFGIYFLKDSSIKFGDILDVDLNDLVLQKRPWISDEDIKFYDWSSHCIYLKKDKTHFFPEWEKDRFNEFPPEWTDKPFIVVANNKKCYRGFIGNALSSYWVAPEIFDGYNNGYPSDIIYMDWPYLFHDSPQQNENVKSALIKSDIYHGGIKIYFNEDDSNTIKIIDNSDTSTISYKFTITNNDIEDLYIIDPLKTGSDLFHRFTNGPVFKHIKTNKIYESTWKTIISLPSLDYWSSLWFTKIKSGESIERSITLKGYPKFIDGEYIFQFKYSGQIFNMEKYKRELSDGRYWIGPTRSNVLMLNYNSKE